MQGYSNYSTLSSTGRTAGRQEYSTAIVMAEFGECWGATMWRLGVTCELRNPGMDLNQMQ